MIINKKSILPYNGNYPPGMNESDIPGMHDDHEEKPLSDMDQWYVTFEDNLCSLVYEQYIKRDPKNVQCINDELTRKIDNDAHELFKAGTDPEAAADKIEDDYMELCKAAKYSVGVAF